MSRTGLTRRNHQTNSRHNTHNSAEAGFYNLKKGWVGGGHCSWALTVDPGFVRGQDPCSMKVWRRETSWKIQKERDKTAILGTTSKSAPFDPSIFFLEVTELWNPAGVIDKISRRQCVNMKMWNIFVNAFVMMRSVNAAKPLHAAVIIYFTVTKPGQRELKQVKCGNSVYYLFYIIWWCCCSTIDAFSPCTFFLARKCRF